MQGSGIFDTQMFCCDSGNMDACGVCDGAGDQCGTRCLLTMPTPDRRRQLLQNEADLITDFARVLDVSEDDVELSFSPDSENADQTVVRFVICSQVLTY